MSGKPIDLTEIKAVSARIADICRAAWEKGFMAGWSGNASVRLRSEPAGALITAAGKAKGRLKEGDFVAVSLAGEKLWGEEKVSSESRLHTHLYEKLPQAKAILHTHPPFMQALDLALNPGGADYINVLKENFLNTGLHESALWRGRLRFAKELPPGSPDLAESAAEAASGENWEPPLAVWLPRHGLCAIGGSLESCLCLTEELEHLAKTQLLSARAR